MRVRRLDLPRLERVGTAADLPATAAVAAKALEEPEKRVYEEHPEKELEPLVGEHTGEPIVRADPNLVMRHVEGHVDFVTVDRSNRGGDGVVHVGSVPTIYELPDASVRCHVITRRAQ